MEMKSGNGEPGKQERRTAAVGPMEVCLRTDWPLIWADFAARIVRAFVLRRTLG